MKEQLEAALLQRYPTLSANYAERYVSKYIDTVMAEIGRQFLHRNTDIDGGELDFAVDRVNHECGRHKIDGKGGYIFKMMQAHSSTSIVIQTYGGNSITRRVSRVVFNPIYKAAIMQALREQEAVDDVERQQELIAKANATICIDEQSLEAYIAQTQNALQQHRSNAYDEKLLRNLMIATQLCKQAVKIDGKTYLREYWETIDSGRIQGYGLSLQCIPKEVRHAALGRCFRYDFKAASYALMTSLALQIDPTLKVAALRDYIRYRSAIRKRIAKRVGISEAWMKQIFTAVGFGASLKDNPYSTIRHMLGQEKYHKLVCDIEFMQIKAQLDEVCATILKAVGKGDFCLFDTDYSEINPKGGAKRTKNQKLAWLYQRMESDALALFMGALPEGYEVRLMVHDCAYLNKQLAARHLADIGYKLQQRYALLFFEGEQIVRWGEDSIR